VYQYVCVCCRMLTYADTHRISGQSCRRPTPNACRQARDVCVCVCVCRCVCVCLSVCMYVCTYMYVCMYCVCLCVCMHVYIYIGHFIHTHTHTHTHTQAITYTLSLFSLSLSLPPSLSLLAGTNVRALQQAISAIKTEAETAEEHAGTQFT